MVNQLQQRQIEIRVLAPGILQNIGSGVQRFDIIAGQDCQQYGLAGFRFMSPESMKRCIRPDTSVGIIKHLLHAGVDR